MMFSPVARRAKSSLVSARLMPNAALAPSDAATMDSCTLRTILPATYTPGTLPREVVLTIGWGAVQRLDLEPAGSSDPNCDADHVYTGSATADDLSLRVSEAGDSPETVAQALVFARALSEATIANRV